MSDKPIQENQQILTAMESAMLGDREAGREFFLAFLEGPLFVPDRYQHEKMSDQPDYPSDLVSVLGLAHQDQVTVPVFTNPAYIEEWCGNNLEHKELSGKQLLERVPEEWWVCVNPGCEVEKELSPWELTQLRDGENGIPLLLEELFKPDIATMIEIEPGDEHYPKLSSALKEHAESVPEIKAIYLGRELGEGVEGDSIYSAAIGIVIDSADNERTEEIGEAVKRLAAPFLIGDDRLKVHWGSDPENSVLLGAFVSLEPIYKRSKFKKIFSGLMPPKAKKLKDRDEDE